MVIIRFFRRSALPIVIAGAAISAGAMWLAYNPDVDPSRIYYGTDTRVSSLLIGVALALGLAQAKTGQSSSRAASRVLDLAGCGLAAVVWYFLVLDETQELVYRVGCPGLETATAVVILSLAYPQNARDALASRWASIAVDWAEILRNLFVALARLHGDTPPA